MAEEGSPIRPRVRAIALAAIVPLILLTWLQWHATQYAADSDVIAAPTASVKAWLEALGDGTLLHSTAFTLAAAMSGWAIAMALGSIVGIAVGSSRTASDVSFMTIEALRTFPPVALIPLAMLIFGFGMAMEVFVVAFACFWPVLILAQRAVGLVDRTLIEVSQVYQLSGWDRVRKITLPAILPRLFVAVRLTVGVALIVAVTVEVAANPKGMGYALLTAQQSLAPALMQAWLFWIGVVGVLLNALALWLQRRMSRRMSA